MPPGLLLIAFSSNAPPSARVSYDFYGINLAAIPSQKDARRMAHGGAKMARYPFDWRGLPAGLIGRHGHGKPAWSSYKQFATR